MGKNGFSVVEADPRSPSPYGSGVPRNMKGCGDEGDAKNGSMNGSGVVLVVVVVSSCLFGCSA